MSYTPLKVKYGSVMGHDPASIFVGMGQMTWPGFFGMEPRILAGVSFGLGALAMHLMHRSRVLGMNRRSRRSGRRRRR